MPHLHWIGKEKVVHHHNDVRYRPLVAKETFGDEESAKGNMIIHGDNLEALKSLLPQYEGRVDCIYIDPPYNTGNEGWVYNDNVNHPKIKKWLGEIVGKEGEDLSRHDKWLCMMYPRLKLLRRLLRETGSIWVSIDDKEHSNLRLILDEIFGMSCFVSNVVWQHSIQGKGYVGSFSLHHNHILVYAKSPDFELGLLDRSDEDNVNYSNPDNDPNGLWRSGDVRNGLYRPNLIYDVVTPSGKIISPPENGWRWSMETMQEKMATGEIVFSKDETRIIRKIYLAKQEGRVPETIWFGKDSGTTREANSELKEIFGESPFPTPKPTRLIERVLQVASKPESIILDSFAGSGTTAHAVMKLNAEDQGNRKFILVEMEDYADSITAERVRRVIRGYGEGDKAVTGLGGGFTFYELDSPLFDEKGNLSEPIDLPKLREYVWYVETKAPYTVQAQSEYLGCFQGIGYYLLMDDSGPIPLTYGTLGKITQKQDGYVIYGESCSLSEEFLLKNHITFKKIPNQLARI